MLINNHLAKWFISIERREGKGRGNTYSACYEYILSSHPAVWYSLHALECRKAQSGKSSKSIFIKRKHFPGYRKHKLQSWSFVMLLQQALPKLSKKVWVLMGDEKFEIWNLRYDLSPMSMNCFSLGVNCSSVNYKMKGS